MKPFLVYFLILLLGTNLIAQKNVKLRYDNKIDFIKAKSFVIGFEFDNKRGKIKKRGKYFHKRRYLRQFDLEIQGGTYDRKKGRVIIDRNETKKLNNYLIIKFRHPRNKEITETERIPIPYVTQLKSNNISATFNEEIKLDIHALYSNGEARKIPPDRLDQFLTNNDISISCKGGQYLIYGKTKVDVLSNDSTNNKYLKVSFHSQNPDFIPKASSIPLLNIKDFQLISNINYGSTNQIALEANFDNNTSRHFVGKSAFDLLNGYGIQLTSNHGELFSGNIQIPPFSEKSPERLILEAKGNKFNKSFSFKIHLKKSFNFDFSGNTKGWTLWADGTPGGHGKDVNVYLVKVSDSTNNYKAIIKTKSQTDTVYFNPEFGTITIKNFGGDGKNGIRGERGDDETADSPATRGGPGGPGGDGGDGGDVTIEAPRSFRAYKNAIIVENHGGDAGFGGNGGKGGLIDNEGKRTLLSALLPDRADKGHDGPDGRKGRNGKVWFDFYQD